MKTCNEIFSENREWAKGVLERIDAKMSHVTLRSRSKLPDGVDENGIHVDRDVTWWTNGFWGGLNWLLYNATEKDDYRLTARESERLLDGAFLRFDDLHHDVGFMWHILSGASYCLTGDKQSRSRSLYAASILASRYVPGGGFIRAWNGDSKFYSDTANLTIIDTMMNLPLLYWASRETGDDRFSRVAMSHADNTLRTHIRPDGSVAHIVIHDRESGDKLDECGGQGYAVGSSWTRGQGWAIYGFVLSYIHTGERRYLDTSRRVADYFISELPDDCLVPLDFRAPKVPAYYDSTAAAIAASGMLELARLLPEDESGVYAEYAVKLLRTLEERFVCYDSSRDDLLKYCSVRYPSLDIDADGSTLSKIIHVSIIYGDFYFTEAVLKLLGSDFNIW